ncbi:MAG: protein kinase [Verrucomicrobiaceae bacterium]
MKPSPPSSLAKADTLVDGLSARRLGALNLSAETMPAVEGSPEPLAPEALAPFFPQLEILECLGRGGMGVVYKARQKSLNRLVALKLLAPERAGDPFFADRFEKEAQALAALNHPNIVGVHDFGLAGGFYFLLMEYVDGLNLRQVLHERRLSPQEALSIIPPVCEALQCAHSRGIVHRDIKPENLLLDRSGGVKIADFGIAKMLHSAPDFGAGAPPPANMPLASLPFGTPDYAAPEQADGQSDHRADIYSLGVVLYEMLTGERPREQAEPPSKRVQVDMRIDEIVLRALEKTPELRFATAAEFRTQVQAAAGQDQPVKTDLSRFTDDPKNWYLWFIYHCREDSRITVPTRIPGLGWTLNFAHPWAVPFLVALCLGVWAVYALMEATGTYRRYGTWTMLILLVLIVLLFQKLSNPNRPSKHP